MRSQEEILAMNPKFNKDKCLHCKYAGVGEGYYVKIDEEHSVKIFCNYTSIKKESCIQLVNPKAHKPNEIYDIRGDEYNNCLKFEKREKPIIVKEDANDD